MRYLVIALNVVGLLFAGFTLIGRLFVPTPLDATLIGTVLTFLPFVLGLVSLYNPASAVLRFAAVAANALGVLVVLAAIFVALRSEIVTAYRITLFLALVALLPCLVNLLVLVRRRPAPRSAAA